jgi:hypothetical protein
VLLKASGETHAELGGRPLSGGLDQLSQFLALRGPDARGSLDTPAPLISISRSSSPILLSLAAAPPPAAAAAAARGAAGGACHLGVPAIPLG